MRLASRRAVPHDPAPIEHSRHAFLDFDSASTPDRQAARRCRVFARRRMHFRHSRRTAVSFILRTEALVLTPWWMIRRLGGTACTTRELAATPAAPALGGAGCHIRRCPKSPSAWQRQRGKARVNRPGAVTCMPLGCMLEPRCILHCTLHACMQACMPLARCHAASRPCCISCAQAAPAGRAKVGNCEGQVRHEAPHGAPISDRRMGRGRFAGRWPALLDHPAMVKCPIAQSGTLTSRPASRCQHCHCVRAGKASVTTVNGRRAGGG